ncbi:MAG: hypothetical protein HKP58_14170 [Desulfatitalea sp.]|nr:hypothetical protein [Desulfatitalea sp.]NNK01550.1 hypothetical protein [Desulfatitalea sp.]
MKKCTTAIILLVLLHVNLAAAKSAPPLQQCVAKVIGTALTQLKAHPRNCQLACLTNAGYVTYEGQSTLAALDLLAQETNISVGKGNLLQVHSADDETLWFAFVFKKSPKDLLLTYIKPAGDTVEATAPMNVYVDINQSFDEFTHVLGKKAFALVTFANGWADKIPKDLLSGALWHDHLCSGVFSGLFTVNFIRAHLPLKEGERYVYIGAPAWCQDDYICRVLNLTPGKHGYYTMGYPWSRPWTTAEKSYPNLGGIIVRFNSATKSGDAHLLQFDWREEDFKESIAIPELSLNWGKNPWLHVRYNRFFMQHLDHPEMFVSILKRKKLTSQQALNRIVDMGANPLQEMLGPDDTWVPERD